MTENRSFTYTHLHCNLRKRQSFRKPEFDNPPCLFREVRLYDSLHLGENQLIAALFRFIHIDIKVIEGGNALMRLTVPYVVDAPVAHRPEQICSRKICRKRVCIKQRSKDVMDNVARKIIVMQQSQRHTMELPIMRFEKPFYVIYACHALYRHASMRKLNPKMFFFDDCCKFNFYRAKKACQNEFDTLQDSRKCNMLPKPCVFQLYYSSSLVEGKSAS